MTGAVANASAPVLHLNMKNLIFRRLAFVPDRLLIPRILNNLVFRRPAPIPAPLHIPRILNVTDFPTLLASMWTVLCDPTDFFSGLGPSPCVWLRQRTVPCRYPLFYRLRQISCYSRKTTHKGQDYGIIFVIILKKPLPDFQRPGRCKHVNNV